MSSSDSGDSFATASDSGDSIATASDTVPADPSGNFPADPGGDFEERTTRGRRGKDEWSALNKLSGGRGISDGMYPHRWHMQRWICAPDGEQERAEWYTEAQLLFVVTKFLEGESNVEEDAQADMLTHLKRFLLRRSRVCCVLALDGDLELREERWWFRLPLVPASLRSAFDDEFPSFLRQSLATGRSPFFQEYMAPRGKSKKKANGLGEGKGNGDAIGQTSGKLDALSRAP